MSLTRNFMSARRFALAGLLLLATALASGSEPAADADETGTAVEVVVYKTPYCGCCKFWVEHLEDAGLEVTAIDVDSTAGMREELGVPRNLASCHTARVGDYWVEGHVPADLVRRLALERPPGIRGLAVPGMPIGSPGMEGPNPVRYAVLSVDDEGEVEVYAERDGDARPPH